MDNDTIQSSDFSCGVMHNLAIAFAKAGISPTDVETLARGKRAKKLLERLARDIHGDDIDCAGKPFIPNGLSYDEKDQLKSAFRGKLKAGKIFENLYLDDRQKNGTLVGDALKLALEGKAVLTAHCLDFVLRPENQHLIPEELKGKAIFFWGSIYRYSGGTLCVRCLYWFGGQWHSSSHWLDCDWSANSPAAMLAS